MEKVSSIDITPEHVYLSRRAFMIGVGALVTGTVLSSACKRVGLTPTPGAGGDFCDSTTAAAARDELGAALTPCKDITNYNNFYEFTQSKEDVAPLSRGFRVSPWTVQVGGLVNRPRTYDVDELERRFPSQERVYRLRCVEAWSMVIPWLGFPLAKLLNEVEPTSNAKYVRFETLYDPQQMHGQEDRSFPWPYVEGLRLDEAMHDLTVLATGLYGKPLPPQDGAPLRLVVPWKYGFKSIKSVVKIDLVEDLPVSFWMEYSPREYGFYANVNPDVPHPRWSQSSERRIGQSGRMRTLPFNGYRDQVAHLYSGMDLEKFF